MTLSVPLIFVIIGIVLCVGSIYGKIPAWAWGFCIFLVLLLMLLK